MRQHGTLFLLFLRQSAWKVLLLLVVMAAAEAALFLAFMPNPAENSLETVLRLTQFPLTLVLLAAWGLLWAVLISGGSRGAYTLDRLSQKPEAVLLWQSLFNFLAGLLFWGVQVLVLFLLCRLYQHQGGFVGPQTLYLACWQSDLFHTVLPMDEWTRWLRNLILCAGMGLTIACASARLRHKGKPIAVFVLLGGTLPLLIQPLGAVTADVLVMVETAVIAGVALFNALSLGKEDDEHEEVPPQ